MSSQSERLDAKTSEAQLFLCRPDSITDPALLECYHALLDVDERARLSHYRLERDQRTFLISHALVRAALSQCANVAVDAWRFRIDRYGRPEIANPAGPRLRFSLSRTSCLVACVVTCTHEIGIDVEVAEDSGDLRALAERSLAPRELSAWRALPTERQIDRFFSIWTLKEAYAKARGQGLLFPLDGVTFQIEGGAIEVKFDGEIVDVRADWWFSLMRPTPEHWLALAVRIGQPACPKVNARWLVPLTSLSQQEGCPIIAVSRRANLARA